MKHPFLLCDRCKIPLTPIVTYVYLFRLMTRFALCLMGKPIDANIHKILCKALYLIIGMP